jgi:hypothetical protein
VRHVLGQRVTPETGEELVDIVRPLQLRHRLRAVLKCYSRFHLLRVLPQLTVLAIGEIAFALVSRRRRVAAAIWSAWRDNLGWRALRELRGPRKTLQSQRALPDREIRRLQVRGSARVTAFLRGQLTATHPGEAIAAAGRDFADSVRRGERRLHLTVWSVLVVLLVAGSRHLITRPLPPIGQFVPWPESAWDMVRFFVAGWHPGGLGSESPAPFAFALLGGAGTVLLGATGAMQKLLVLGCLPLGLVGAHRLARPLGSDRAPLVAVVAYAAVPLPYNAMAAGRLSTLVGYAAAPWVLSRLAHGGGFAPFQPARGTMARQALPLAVLVALAVGLAPTFLATVGVIVVGLVAGSLAAGRLRGALRAAGLAVIATAGAAALLFPWTLEFVLPGAEVATFTGLGAPGADAPPLGNLLRFQTGPMGAAPLGWGVLAAAAVPLLLARAERLEWSVRLWTIGIAGWGAAWCGARGWLPLGGATDAALVAAAVALSLAAATGVSALERELRSYRFGWRQLGAVVGIGGLALGALPLAIEAVDGRWEARARGHASLLSWLPERQADGMFRVLWIGDPRVVPSGGWSIREGLAYTTSRDGLPDATTLWPPGSEGATELIADAVEVAERDETRSLGRLLAPMAIRYVVVPLRAAADGGTRHDPPRGFRRALGSQIDLKRIDAAEALIVYENTSWLPGRVALSAAAAEAAGRTVSATPSADLAGAPVLRRHDGPLRWSGSVDGDSVVHVAEAASPGWQLEVDGKGMPRRKSFGFANAYDVDAAGSATLRYRPALSHYAAILLELGLWVFAVTRAWQWRRAERTSGRDEHGERA